MLKCLECGNVFDDTELAYWRESRGEYFGAACSVRVSGSPCCHGEYDEAKRCEKCGEFFTDDELDEDYLCEDCAKED